MYYPRERKNCEQIYNVAEAMLPLPRLAPLRRVPLRYSSLLPLHMILRYQCIVIGKSKGSITVAFTDQKSLYILPLIADLTGCHVFPVTIDSCLMRLLLQRLVRAEREKRWGRYRYAERVQIVDGSVQPSLHTMIQFLTSPSMKLYQRDK
ncbi:hypothetical protein [Dictyobacter formicarum]|uniref:Type II secretion system protein GspE N-terminal domain-containing protein n=1 Tax=Dictyobacter formicarum TaxID=2778368 RepID=A0ABQ3VET8_9CHLR|nr:hypothetical protein [Dictyobacter formicarum]GHO84328.1 hypothetical protein KSZ_23340 [Dictyobacter formicarum]